MVKRYRDTVHKDIHLSELAVSIMDTREFQRTDRIKQLGFSVYGFRGAKHSRFEHLVGAYHVAMDIIDHAAANHANMPDLPFPHELLGDKLGSSPEEKIRNVKAIVGIAALLHDITHVPHGHSLEDEYNNFYKKHDSVDSMRLYYLLFDPNSQIANVFGREKAFVPPLSNEELRHLLFVILKHQSIVEWNRIISFDDIIEETRNNATGQDSVLSMLGMLQTDYQKFKKDGTYHHFMSDVCSNTICADLLDYLPRDSRGTGIVADIDPRIYEYFIIAEESQTKELRLAIRVRDPKGIEEMMFSERLLKSWSRGES